MYRVDCHIHSRISRDSKVSRADMAAAAVLCGLQEICFTDHYDVIDFDGSYNPTFDWAPVRAEQQEALNFCGCKVRIRYGLELGNAPRDFSAADRVLSEPDLDFVLCSVHNLCAERDGTDFYEVHYDSPALCQDHLDDYFHTMEQSVRWGNFDVLAHIPYPLRYMRERDRQPISLTPWREQVREILKIAAENGQGIEVNAKGWSPQIAADYAALLTDWKELGGEIVTVGSDAHKYEDVGAHVREACACILNSGFRYIAVYEERKPRFLPLDEGW